MKFETLLRSGLKLLDKNDYQAAIPLFQKALTLNPSLEKVRLALFSAFLKQGDRNSASAQIEEFRKMKKTAIVQALEARMRGASTAS